MNALAAKWGLLALVVLALMLGTGACAWIWQANSYGKKLAEQKSTFDTDLTSIANAGAAQSRQALAKQQSAEQALAVLDQKATEEKTNALAENDKLRADVASGARRLRIAGSCRADSGNVPGTASTTSLGNGGAVELAPAAGRAVFDIRAGIIADQAALKALQAYVTNVCR